jgi:uncharacterized protein YodC (DUF2158 family)
MSEHTFKPGDVVQLKSGGPLMTLISSDTESNWTCAWYNDTKYSYELIAAIALQYHGTT